MKSVILSLMLLFSVSSFARVQEAPAPQAVQDARAKLVSEEVRTTMHSIMNTDGNPCLSPGKSWQVEVQVKKDERALDKKGDLTVVSKWETVRTVVIDKDGGVMEECLE
jgi:hypothetical protein